MNKTVNSHWLYIHCPHLYTDIWHREFTHKQASALVDEQQHTVLDANEIAQHQGVECGQGIATAFCLSPQLRLIAYKKHLQQQALDKISRRATAFSAWVGQDYPCGLYLEIASMFKLLGPATAIVNKVREAFRSLGVTTWIASAPTAKAARLLARSNRQQSLNQQQLIEVLSTIPSGELGVGEKAEINLLKSGLKHLGDLLPLSTSDIAYRIDLSLAQEIEQITGRRPWQPPLFQEQEIFKDHIQLEQEFESLEPLRFFMLNSLQRFCHFLQKRNLVSRTLVLKLYHRKQNNTYLDIHLAKLDNRTQSWQYMFNMSLNRLVLTAPVIGIDILSKQFEKLNDADGTAPTLFPSPQQESTHHKSQLLNRLSARLGINALSFLHIHTDPRPQFKSRYVPEYCPWLPQAINTSHAPLWLFHQALPINVEEHTPIRGPVRFTTGWWDQQQIHRDYYASHTKEYQLHWIFKDMASNQWFSHGLFA